MCVNLFALEHRQKKTKKQRLSAIKTYDVKEVNSYFQFGFI